MDSVSGIGFRHNEAPDVVTKGQKGGPDWGASLLPLGTFARQIDCKRLSPGRGLICPVNMFATYGKALRPDNMEVGTDSRQDGFDRGSPASFSQLGPAYAQESSTVR